jgi:hypothetical protein
MPARPYAIRHLGAWLYLLAVFAQLGLPVVHIWDVPLEVTTAAFQLVAGGAKGPSALRSPLAASRHVPHDASQCPVCQTFVHMRDILVAHGSTVCPVSAYVVLLTDIPGDRASPELTVAGPRAPPGSFS